MAHPLFLNLDSLEFRIFWIESDFNPKNPQI